MNPRMRSLVALSPRPNLRRVHPLDAHERAMTDWAKDDHPNAWDRTTQTILVALVVLGLSCWGLYLWWVTA